MNFCNKENKENKVKSNTSWIRWSAYFYAPSGYSESARSFIKALYLKNFFVNTYSPPFKNNMMLSPDLQKIIDFSNNVNLEDDFIDIQHMIPESLTIDNSARYRIGRIFFELDGIPESWSEKIRHFDEIWVASEHIKKAFLNSGVEESKIRIIPECIEIEKYNSCTKPLDIPGKKKFAFLSIFDWRIQKGWDVLIESFASEFSACDDVCLVLKVFSSAGFPVEEIKEQVSGYMIKKMGLKKEEVPEVIFVEDILSSEDMVRLIKTCDVFVLPSRGEGWGRPYMEAMLMEKPVIGTKWGGHLDFMNDSNSFLIDCTVEKVSREGVIEVPNYKGLNWANPSTKSLRELLRYVYGNYDAALQKARVASKTIKSRYNLDTASNLIINRLNQIKSEPGRSRKIVLEGNFLSFRSLASINREIIKRIGKDKNYTSAIKSDEDFNRYYELIFKKDTEINKSCSGSGENAFMKNSVVLKRDEIIKLMSCAGNSKLIDDADFYIYHNSPPLFKPPGRGYWIMMQPWEFGRLPVDWIYPFNNLIDCVWVYSDFLKSCYIDSGVSPDKISVIHPGVNSNIFNERAGKLNLDTRKKFKFLFVGGSIARKGIDNLLNAYINEFNADEDVCLVIKDVMADYIYSRLNISDELERVSKNKKYPEILYIKENYHSLKEVAFLYNSSDCLVHPYKAEGFGLPIAEAMSCGIPVIVTNYGACLDYCNHHNAFLVDCKIEKFSQKRVGTVETVDYPFWAEVDISDLRMKMRQVYENYNEALIKAEKAQKDIRENFDWEHTLREIKDSLCRIGKKRIVRLDTAGQQEFDRNKNHPSEKEDCLLYRQALKLINEGRIKEGKQFLEKTLDANPYHSGAIQELSLYYHKKNMNEKALSLLYKYLKDNPGDDEILNLAGVYLTCSKELKLAEIFFLKVLKMNPGNKSLINNLNTVRRALKNKRNRKISAKYSYLLSILGEERDSKSNVTLCMIVKNEQKSIEKCLESVRGAVSEIIVVDTGSTDDTVSAARSCGARVMEYRWDDDFSKARNESIKYASSDWILFLDADEHLDKSSFLFLKNLQKIEEPRAYYVKIINISENSCEDQTSEHYSLRLFNNGMGFKFTGCIHEQLKLTDKDLKYSRLMSNIIINHTGYSRSVMEDRNKNIRNYALLEKAIRNDPDNPFNLYNMGIYYYANKKYKEAVETFDIMIKKLGGKIVPYLPFAYSFKSSSLVSIKRYMEAVKCAGEALKIAPNLKDALYNLANAQFNLGEYENAIDNFKKASGDDKNDEIFLGGSMDLGAKSWKSFNGIGAAYLRMKKYEEAAKFLEKAYEMEKRSSMIILNLIMAYKNQNRVDRIKELLKKTGSILFSVMQTQQLVNQLLYLDLNDEAACLLENTISLYKERGLKTDSENIDVSILKRNIAEIFFAMAKYDEAKEAYEKYLAAHGEDGEALKKYGITNFILGYDPRAEKVLEDAITFDEHDWESYYNLAAVKMKMKKFDEAIAYFEKSIDLNPDYLESYLNLGTIYIFMNEYYKANQVLEKALDMDKENKIPDLLFINSEALFHLKEYTRAIDNLLLYTGLNKNNAAAFNRLGLCLYKIDKHTEAVNLFSHATELDNGNPDYFINLGNALRKLKKYDDARMAFKCALLMDRNNTAAKIGYEALVISKSLNN